MGLRGNRRRQKKKIAQKMQSERDKKIYRTKMKAEEPKKTFWEKALTFFRGLFR